MNCPNCGEKICSGMICNDGGSIFCEHCKINFHTCLGGKIKYGLPGPVMCPTCKMNCPNCDGKLTSRITLNDGGSIFCQHCKATFHICMNGIIKYGSPGPSLCSFCNVEKLLEN
jgi:hypothetical protein